MGYYLFVQTKLTYLIVEGERDCEATGTCELVPGKSSHFHFNLCMHQTFWRKYTLANQNNNHKLTRGEKPLIPFLPNKMYGIEM